MVDMHRKPDKPRGKITRLAGSTGGRRYRGTFEDGRCVLLKQWVLAGRGYWRLCDLNGPKSAAAITFLKEHGQNFNG